MLITASEFLDSGVRISNDISTSEVEFAIRTVEEFYLKPAITDENYIDLNSNPTTEPNRTLIGGGVIEGKDYAGLKYALYHLVFAWISTENQRITRYSTVEKNSEFSKNTEREDILQQARAHWDIGLSAVAEVQGYYGLDTTHNNKNNLFETIVW